MLIIDDGSTDNSKQIVDDRIQNTDACIKYFKQENKGVSSARNRGIELAEGRYICFFDCDDMITDNFYQSLIEGYQNKVEMSFCEWKLMNNPLDIKPDCSKNKIVSSVDFAKKYLYQQQDVHLCSIMFRKDIIDSHGIRFRDDLRYGEDQSFIWNYLVYCKELYLSKTCNYLYRVSENSAMKKNTPEKLKLISAFEDNETLIQTNMPAFFPKYKRYAVPRAILAIVKDSAKNKNKRQYLSLCNQYKKVRLFDLLFHGSLTIRVASLLFIVSKRAFYYFFSHFGDMQ